MPISFHQYTKSKDNYCCCYLGNSPEYIVLLKLLKPQIEKQLPGLNFWITCRDEFKYLLNNESNTLTLKDFDNYKQNFSYVRELRNNHKSHSVYDLMIESDLKVNSVCDTVSGEKSKLCLVCPEGIEPTKSLKEESLKLLVNKVTAMGYTPIVLGSDIHYSLNIKIRPKESEKLKYIENAGFVIGVENEYLVLSAIKGIKTTLIKSGVGENLFKSLFPLIEVVQSI